MPKNKKLKIEGLEHHKQLLREKEQKRKEKKISILAIKPGLKR